MSAVRFLLNGTPCSEDGAPPSMTVLDWLRPFDPQASTEELRGVLGQMLFQREEGLKPTDALSGGEAARLLFCKLMLQKPNVLVFDEPTNTWTWNPSTH